MITLLTVMNRQKLKSIDFQGNIDALTKIAIKCLILFIEMFFFVVVHAYYVRLKQEQDPPPYDTIA